MKLFNKAYTDVSSTSKCHYTFDAAKTTKESNQLADPYEQDNNSIFTHGLDAFGFSSIIKSPFSQ
jgi:hypothetical protein